MKYNVGDLVKVVKGKGTGFAGCIGTVLEVNPELLYEYTILIDSKKRWFKESELELVQEPAENVSVNLSVKQYNPLEVQEGGGHYKGKGIQPLEYANANDLNPQKFNIVKYITRHEEKNQVEDLSKVIHYALLEAYFQYGVEGSTELKQRVLKMLGENDG